MPRSANECHILWTNARTDRPQGFLKLEMIGLVKIGMSAQQLSEVHSRIAMGKNQQEIQRIGYSMRHNRHG